MPFSTATDEFLFALWDNHFRRQSQLGKERGAVAYVDQMHVRI